LNVIRAAVGVVAACVAVCAHSLQAAALEDVIARVKRSVVAVGTFDQTRNPRFQFRGTGFAVADGTVIATNAHVLPALLNQERRETIAVILPPNASGEAERREATVALQDADHDLALLKITGAPLVPLPISRDAVREGQSMAFTGFPLGAALGLVPVTHRATIGAITPIALPPPNVSQLNVPLMQRLKSGVFQVLQLDATAYPGNSGSPLYDASSGEVVGIINSVFVKATKETVISQPSGITFAVPAQYLQTLISAHK